jgi:hypothetical protein
VTEQVDQWRKVRLSDKIFRELATGRVQWIGPDEEGFYTPTVWHPHQCELVEDHELCETQVSELVGELQHLKDSPAWTQLSHAQKDRITRAIRTRGLPRG